MFFSPVRASRAYFNPYGALPRVGLSSEALDRIFSSTAESADQRSEVEADDTTITLSLDVPGISKEQLTVSVEGRIIRIRSKDDAPRSFKSAYKLASDVDLAKSQASLENGVLTIKLAKVAPESRETLLTIN